MAGVCVASTDSYGFCNSPLHQTAARTVLAYMVMHMRETYISYTYMYPYIHTHIHINDSSDRVLIYVCSIACVALRVFHGVCFVAFQVHVFSLRVNARIYNVMKHTNETHAMKHTRGIYIYITKQAL